MKKIEAFLNRLFSPDGSFMDFLTQVADVLLAGVLWLVCSIPVVTIGASTAAMYQVLLNVLDGREDGVLRDFFGAFRHRFGFYTKLWLVLLALGLFFGLDLYFYYLWSAAGSWMGVVLFWVHDRSPEQRRTRRLIDGAVPLVDRLVGLSRMRVLRPALRQILALIDTVRRDSA